MKKVMLLILAFVIITSCEEKEENYTADYIIELESLTNTSGDWNKEDDSYELTSEEGWISFDHEINEPGRYSVQIVAEGEGSVWLEDYVGNKDGRTYNITGNMSISGSEEMLVTKEGSPLNKGVHPFRLHVKGSGVEVDKLLLTKMIDHEVTPVSMEQSVEGSEWQLVWSDEFDGEGAPDKEKWTYDVGNWGWGNNEPQYYTNDRRENARLEDGNLIIEARRDDMGEAWTSARLTTRGKTSFLYGKIEFRAKAPASDGTWAAGWLLGDAYVDELSWPYCGEIDVLECVGSEIDDETGDGINHASCHTRKYYFKEGTSITAVTDVKDMDDTYHTYSIEWNPEGIKAFVDDVHYYTYDKTADKLEWPFDEPQNIILNLAMGGGMGGAIDPSTTSAKFIIDYVRVYGLN